MPKFIPNLTIFFCLAFLGSCGNTRPSLLNQYHIQSDMIINESGCGHGTWIADEQYSDKPATFWDGHDKELCSDYKASLIVDLTQMVGITNIFIYCSSETEAYVGVFTNYKMDNGPVMKFVEGWNKISFNKAAKFIRIEVKNNGRIGEVLVDADKKYNSNNVNKQAKNKVAVNEFVGTNAFVDVPIGLLEPFGCIREYHDWPDWNEPQKDSISLNIAKNGFDFELFYTNLSGLGKTVVPVIQKSPLWLTSSQNSQSKPAQKASLFDNPLVYSRHSYFMHRYAANFFNKKTNVIYYENWNEPDKWWENRESYFTPYQYAAMSSADKDGHNQKLIPDYGIGNKGAKLVMAGLANPKIDYLHALKHWCDVNRGGRFAWDVINFHQYSNSATLPDDQPIMGISPESGKIYEKTKEIIAFRDKYLPNVDVWVSEFGFDTEKSPQQCPSIGGKTSELVQADWLIRSYLLYSAAGVDKAFQFMIRDFGKEGLYATSGVYSTTLHAEPYMKSSWNYINTFRNALSGSSFQDIKVDSINDVYVSKYVNIEDPELKTWLIWHGSQEGKRTAKYKLPISSPSKYRVVEFSPGKACGEVRPLFDGNIDVTETPLIIQEHKNGTFPVCTTSEKMDVGKIVCKNEQGEVVTPLLDEQNTVGNPAYGINGLNPTTFWKSSYAKDIKNAVTFDLLHPVLINYITIFDGAGDGEVAIYDKNNDSWRYITSIKMNSYNKWKMAVLNIKSRYIKLEVVNGKPDVGELIFYVNTQF